MIEFVILGLVLIYVIAAIIVIRSPQQYTAVSPNQLTFDKLKAVIASTPSPDGIASTRDTIEIIPVSPRSRPGWAVQKMTLNIQRQPDNGGWYLERGKAFLEMRQFTEAMADFSKLIQLHPTIGYAYWLRGLCYFHLGNKEQALKDLREYKQLESGKFLEETASAILEEMEQEITLVKIW
jgi:tetratricopeptide (TPR) repeat protein